MALNQSSGHPLGTEAFKSAESFIWSNARLLDRRLFSYHFRGESRDAALTALTGYQNPDGGFGHALEPDMRCPDSQPVFTQVGLETLDEIGFDSEIAGRACDYLASIATPEGGVPNALPSVMNYPRAGWWNAEENPSASINPTGALAGILFKNRVTHPWLDDAERYCWRVIEESETEEAHQLLCVFTFLEHVPDRDRAERQLKRAGERLLDRGLVALDPDAGGYVQPPLVWAPHPGNYCRQLFSDDLIETHLDALISRQQPDGGWTISWPAVSLACEMEWRGRITLSALRTLRAYGRLAEGRSNDDGT